MTGALVADRPGRVTAYAAHAMADRGELIVEAGTEVYGGMVVGERNRSIDLERQHRQGEEAHEHAELHLGPDGDPAAAAALSLDQCIEFIAEDELVEVTPEHIRLRKMEFDPAKRLATKRKEGRMTESDS